MMQWLTHHTRLQLLQQIGVRLANIDPRFELRIEDVSQVGQPGVVRVQPHTRYPGTHTCPRTGQTA